MNRERLKTITLSILVAISILLTQWLWFPSPIKILRSEAKIGRGSDIVIVEERKNVISPNTIIASFGAGDRKKNHYTVLSSNLDFVWDQSKDVLKDYFLGDPTITSINYDTYAQANTLKSVELEFGNNIPTILVSSIFDSLDNKIIRNIKGIKKVLIPALNRGVIYIFENKDNIFEIKLSNYEENSSLIGIIGELGNTEYIKYHPIFSLFEELDENYTAMPINYSLATAQTFVESEIDVNNESMLIEQSKNFFNENFDFVKTIKETNGAAVYIYGYGEKSVRINNKGALEYSEEIGNISSTNIVASLDAAIEFISRNNKFPEGAYLKDIQAIENGQNKGYQFAFGYRIGGFPVEFNSNKMEHSIEIEVYGDKIRGYRSLVREVMDIQGVNPDQEILYFPNIIERNIKHLKLQYFNNESKLDEGIDDEEKILQILKDIEEVKMVYFDTVEENKEQLLRPSWMIKIKNDIYYFDGYTGELINSVMLN